MEKTKKILDWLKTKTATTFFSIIALIGGFSFLRYPLTGGVILGREFFFSPISLVGALLILCGVVLGVYTLKKRGD